MNASEFVHLSPSPGIAAESCSVRSSMQTASPEFSGLLSIPADARSREGPNITAVRGASASCTRGRCSGTARRSSCLGILAPVWVWVWFFFSISPISLSFPSCPAGSDGDRYAPSPCSRLAVPPPPLLRLPILYGVSLKCSLIRAHSSRST